MAGTEEKKEEKTPVVYRPILTNLLRSVRRRLLRMMIAQKLEQRQRSEALLIRGPRR